MARKKRSSDAKATLDEAERTLYSSFCGAANLLSQLYAHAVAHLKLTFHAGERHALEKLCSWILRQHKEGSRVTTDDILAHIQNELDYGGEDASMSPTPQFQQQHPQAQVLFFTSPSIPNSYGLIGQAPAGFTSQSYQLAQGGCYFNSVLPTGNGARNHEGGTLGQTH